jgi:hypothetical protein
MHISIPSSDDRTFRVVLVLTTHVAQWYRRFRNQNGRFLPDRCIRGQYM